MIILRKPGKRITTVIIADDLAGAKNGSNQIYTTSYEYKTNRIGVMYNGQTLHAPDDFTEIGNNTIALTHVYPDDTDELRANYELEETVHPGSEHGDLFGLLDDDHPQYFNQARGDARYFTKPQVLTISGSLQDQIDEKADIVHYHTFTDSLTDTPTTYSGSGNKVVRVKNDETGLEFIDLGLGVQKKGIQAIGNGVSSVAVTFASAFSGSTYTVTLGLENTNDSSPSAYPMIISSKTAAGFTVLFSGDIDTANYKLNWIAKE